jgi:general secretion pathway protein L
MVVRSRFCAGEKDFITENTMFQVIEEKIVLVLGWLKVSPVGQFFRWWIEELRLAMPDAWQQRIQYALRRVTLSTQGDLVEVGIDNNRKLKPLLTLSGDQDVSLQQQQVEDLLVEEELIEAPRFLLLQLDSVLNTEVRLPAAAEPNLAQVLAFEMDRQTPFRATDVYYDWNILDRGGESGQIRLELYVAPRSEVDALIQAVSGRGFQLTGVDIVDGDNTLGLNLLPPDRRSRVTNRRVRFNMALGAVCVVLLALVMAQSLSLRSHQVHELEEAILAVQGEARAVTRIKEQIEDNSEAAGFLAKKRAETPLSIAVLADITRILPDDTYLDRLVISKTSVQMQGKSQNAQQLIEMVNESPLLDEAAFRGSTRLDARSGLEIFEVNANVVKIGSD